MIFNNRLIGEFTNPISLTNYRSVTSCTGTGVFPATCDAIYSDQASWETAEYPCKDQIHEMYFWGNTYNSNPINPILGIDVKLQDQVREDVHYFNEEAPSYTPYAYPHPLTLD